MAIDGGPSRHDRDPAPTFTFSAEPGATTSCRLAGGAFSPCTSPYGATLGADGPYTFEVRAINGAGNIAIATRAFTLDRSEPAPAPVVEPVVIAAPAALALTNVRTARRGIVKLGRSAPLGSASVARGHWRSP